MIYYKTIRDILYYPIPEFSSLADSSAPGKAGSSWRVRAARNSADLPASFWAWGLGFRVWGFGFRALGSGFIGFRVLGFRSFCVQSSRGSRPKTFASGLLILGPSPDSARPRWVDSNLVTPSLTVTLHPMIRKYQIHEERPTPVCFKSIALGLGLHPKP